MDNIDWDNIEPIGNNVVLKRFQNKEERLPGSLLFMPEDRIEKNIKCEVKAVGKGQYIKGNWYPPECQVGDIVALVQYSGHIFADGWIIADACLIEGKYV